MPVYRLVPPSPTTRSGGPAPTGVPPWSAPPTRTRRAASPRAPSAARWRGRTGTSSSARSGASPTPSRPSRWTTAPTPPKGPPPSWSRRRLSPPEPKGSALLLVVAHQVQRPGAHAHGGGGVDQRLLPPVRDPDLGRLHLRDRRQQLVPVGVVRDHQRQLDPARLRP